MDTENRLVVMNAEVVGAVGKMGKRAQFSSDGCTEVYGRDHCVLYTNVKL